MSRSGLYINNKRVCDIADGANIEFVSKSTNIQGTGMSVINSPNSQVINSFNNQGNNGFINQGSHSGDIHFETSKIIVDGKEFLIDDYAEQQEVKIEIHGNVESVHTQNGNLNVSAKNIKKVHSQNGSITVKAKSVGSVKTLNGVINKFD